MTRKTILPVVLVLCLLFTGCADQPSVTTSPTPLLVEQSSDVTEITMAVRYANYMGANAALLQAREQTVNKLLDDNGIAARLKLVPITAQNSTNTSYLTHDIIWLYTNEYRSHAAASELADITSELDNREMLSRIDDELVWKSMEVYEKVYGIALTMPFDETRCASHSGMTVRTDILGKLGVQTPTTLDELISASLAARDAELPYEIACINGMPPYALHRLYDEWPFFVTSDSLLICDAEGNVSPYPGSEIYERDQKILNELYNLGLLRIYTANDAGMLESEWNDAFAAFSPMPMPIGELVESYTIIQFEPWRENVNLSSRYGWMLAISESCENPELALDVLEFIYTNRDAYDAFVYGKEGADYSLDEEGNITITTNTVFWEMLQHSSLARPLANTKKHEFEYVNKSSLVRLPGRMFTSVDDLQRSALINSEAYKALVSSFTGERNNSQIEADVYTLLGSGLDDYVEKSQVRYAEYFTE